MIAWQPSASLATLRLRAATLARIRAFFEARAVLAVETPVLSQASNPDPHLPSFYCQPYYLQTSPEFHMKRLLAAGSGSIYQISKAFRAEEAGSQHNPEFTLLEWYRVGFDHHQLMEEVDLFLQTVLNTPVAERLSYQALFQSQLHIDPLIASVAQLQQCAQQHQVVLPTGMAADDKDVWLQLLMHSVEPKLGIAQPTFIYDYPASQAALARINPDNPAIAERFEVYIAGVELANGFHELTDAKEQRQRLEKEVQARQRLGLSAVPIDEYFLAALTFGLPPCAGIALGIDRLIMLAADTRRISDVVTFPIDIA